MSVHISRVHGVSQWDVDGDKNDDITLMIMD